MVDLATYLESANNPKLEDVLSGVKHKFAEKNTAKAAVAADSAAFSIPKGTKRLTGEQLDAVTASFAEWYAEAKNPLQRRSRARLWLAFLLMRYGALRLGEVLSIDDRKDFRHKANQLSVRGANARRVLLPQPVMEQIAALLQSPMMFGLGGEIFHLDPGYLRRKFYERAKACALPGKLFNPRVIRHSRAIELLCSGVPLQVVQSFLGQQNLNMTANFLEFSGDAVENIVGRYIEREEKMKTSARNSFTGRVSKIARDGLLVEVELTTMAGLKIVAIITEESQQNLNLVSGSIATAIIKAPWVFLAADNDKSTNSARNCFHGSIAEIKKTEVACEVVTNLADGTKVCSLISRDSVDSMGLVPGMDIQVLFKAFSVIISVG